MKRYIVITIALMAYPLLAFSTSITDTELQPVTGFRAVQPDSEDIQRRAAPPEHEPKFFVRPVIGGNLPKFDHPNLPRPQDFPRPQVNPTPIPGAFWMLGTGLIGLWGIRRKLK